jgi:hypothetical protein
VKSLPHRPARAGDQNDRISLGRRAPSRSPAPYPQADTESRFSSKLDLEPDPKTNIALSSEAEDGFRNRQRPLRLGRGNWSSCPEVDLYVRARDSLAAAIRGSAGVSQSAASDRSRSWVFRKLKSTGLVQPLRGRAPSLGHRRDPARMVLPIKNRQGEKVTMPNFRERTTLVISEERATLSRA